MGGGSAPALAAGEGGEGEVSTFRQPCQSAVPATATAVLVSDWQACHRTAALSLALSLFWYWPTPPAFFCDGFLEIGSPELFA
jgi:hypothetical protein